MHRCISSGLAILLAILLAGCATTKIVSADPKASIYMDGTYLGEDTVEVGQIGPSRKVQLEARRGNVVVGRTSMERSFRWNTVALALYSYGTALYWGRFYPDKVLIPNASPFKPDEDIWSKPIGSEGSDKWTTPLMSNAKAAETAKTVPKPTEALPKDSTDSPILEATIAVPIADSALGASVPTEKAVEKPAETSPWDKALQK